MPIRTSAFGHEQLGVTLLVMCVALLAHGDVHVTQDAELCLHGLQYLMVKRIEKIKGLL